MALFTLTGETDFLGRGQLLPKKFSSRVISISFWPTMRSRLAIFFSFSLSSLVSAEGHGAVVLQLFLPVRQRDRMHLMGVGDLRVGSIRLERSA